MLMRFTSSLVLMLMLGACASMPVPFVGKSEQASAAATTADADDLGSIPTEERSIERDANDIPLESEAANSAAVKQAPLELPVKTVKTPSIRSGNQELFNRGVQLMQEGKPKLALVLFEEVSASQPELAGPWVNIGIIHKGAGRLEDAQSAFEAALKANKYSCDALNQLGILAREAGDFAQAEAHYQECLSANPGYSSAQLNLGILYELYMGRLGAALAAYQDYQLGLNEPDARVNRWVLDLERRVAQQVAQR